MLIIMYIPIIIISSAIDIPEASPITDDEEDMDEGAVNEGVGNDEEITEVTDDEVKEEDEDEEDKDEDEEVGYKEERDERVMDEEVRNEGDGTVGNEAVEVPINIKVHYNYINEHTLYLSLMY